MWFSQLRRLEREDSSFQRDSPHGLYMAVGVYFCDLLTRASAHPAADVQRRVGHPLRCFLDDAPVGLASPSTQTCVRWACCLPNLASRFWPSPCWLEPSVVAAFQSSQEVAPGTRGLLHLQWRRNLGSVPKGSKETFLPAAITSLWNFLSLNVTDEKAARGRGKGENREGVTDYKNILS